MNKIYSLFLLVFAAAGLNAQMLTPTVISSTGGYSSNANGSLSYTVGEMTMVQTFSANGHILTQGFQQPNDNVTGLIDLTQDEFGSFVVYPNPAVDNMWFGFQLPEAGKVQITLYDAIGQKISGSTLRRVHATFSHTRSGLMRILSLLVASLLST